jgi:hypothetical protein
MDDVGRITSSGSWTLATSGMTIPVGCKGILIIGGGTITMTDRDGTSITVASTTTAVFPLRPFAVTSASTVYILS